MTRKMIEIEPGTDSWGAWSAYHRGTKTELKMALCLHDARPFYAWSEWPPERARADRLSRLPALPSAAAPKPEHQVPADGEVARIADRLELAAERNERDRATTLERRKHDTREARAFERAVDAVRSGQTPNLDALHDVGLRLIDDPQELKRGRKPPPLRAKLTNLRDDPVGQMAKRGQIEPEQLDVARRWQALHDVAASVGGSRGIDPSAMKVDGGGFSEPVNDVQFAAIKRLEQLDEALGYVGAAVVRRVLGDRMTVKQLATTMGDTSVLGLKLAGRRLRECLDTLVAVMGVTAKGRARSVPHDGASDMARYADNPLLYSAVRTARSKAG